MTDPLAVLQRIRDMQPRPDRSEHEEEVCDLCTGPIGPDHRHLVDLHSRSLLCACRGCFLLFESAGAGGDHYRSVTDRYTACRVTGLTGPWWERLQIPVGVAFFFFNSSLGRVAAFYPGPAGATESELALDAWADIVDAIPELSTMKPDVEAFLIRTTPQRDTAECYIVPIDACYELVGHLRMLWRGFDGGTEANRKLDSFFAHVAEQAR